MKTQTAKRLTSVIVALMMIFSCLATPAMAAPAPSDAGWTPEEPVPATIEQTADDATYGVDANGDPIAPDAEVRILVRLEETPVYLATGDLQTAALRAPSLETAQLQAERRIEKTLNTQIEVETRFTLLYNGFSFTGEYWMLEAINEMNGVSATIPAQFSLIEDEKDDGTDVSINMTDSVEMTTAAGAWKLGYDGTGTAIAILDTGIGATHEAFSVMPENGKIDQDYLKDVYAKYGSLIHAGSASDLDDIYENAKIPFQWDYFDNDAIPNHTASNHGTHVAGIAAGNNGVDFYGTAPNAQIVVMQVFTDTGGAYWDTILAALEDCAYLGVDAINMSLGSPCGFTSYESATDGFEEAYAALSNAGVCVAVAAGNDASTLEWTNFGCYYEGKDRGLASNPDIGTVGSPATLPGSFAVASVVNSGACGYMTVDGTNYYYGAASYADPMSVLAGNQYELVYVDLAYPEDFETVEDWTGKIAVAKRGTLSFNQKCKNAVAAGAEAIIIFNNVAGSFSTAFSSEIPVGTLSLDDGTALLEAINAGSNIATIYNGMAYAPVAMASSSSWGATADLRITPDIAAPGDGVTSAVATYGTAWIYEYDDSAYETWSGTSMATPSVAAGLSLIKQRVQKLFPDADNEDLVNLTYAFAMSTAHQVNGFVRQQGAGLIDIVSALTTDVYLSVPGSDRPKLELGESEDGTFTFTFTLNNVGSVDHTYTIDYSALTELVSDYDYSGTEWGIEMETTTIQIINETIYDVTSQCDVTGTGTVTVPANSTAEVTMTITCSDELMAYFAEKCPSGMYLEGFVKLASTEDNGVDLSIPYLGFVGDWD